MDFFHCNNCYIQPGPPENRTFWLTNCGHSFCSECANTNDSKCRSCLHECKYIPINNDMPEGLKQFFSDPLKELKKAVKILMIQNKHCKIYMEEYVPKLECKYAQAKMVIENNKNDLDKGKKALENKEAEIQSLRTQISKLKAELDDERKKFTIMQQQLMKNYSPTLPSSPSSFGSNQEEFFTPKLSAKKLANSSFNFMNRQTSNTFTSNLTPSPPGPEKKKLTAMELLFKNKEAAVRNSPCGTPRTPTLRSNQTFNMSVNVTPPSSYNSDDSDAQRMPSPLEMQMRNYQRPSSESNIQRRNTGMTPHKSPSFKSNYFQRPGSSMGRKFF